MAVTTADQFLELLAKSELLTGDQLNAAREAVNGNQDPKALARRLAHEGVLTRWQAGQLLAGRTTFTLGKYRLIDLLGRRGMGNVFLGQHTTMNRRVALKVASKKISADPELLRQFLDEARAVAALDHRNLVQAYSVDKENDSYYMVMEYVEGRSVEEIVEEEGPIDCRAAADIIRQAADGLAHAHEQKVIHGHLRPSNIMVGIEGVVKVLDIGMSQIARIRDEDSGEMVELTPESVTFMAPEQFDEGAAIDGRTDIYSLGCILYYLLTGEPPFNAATAAERIEQHKSAEPSGILKKRPTAPKELVQICRKMMSKKPEDRFRSADVVSQVLSQIHWEDAAPRAKAAPGKPDTAKATAVPKAAPPPPRKKPAGAAASGDPAAEAIAALAALAERKKAARDSSDEFEALGASTGSGNDRAAKPVPAGAKAPAAKAPPPRPKGTRTGPTNDEAAETKTQTDQRRRKADTAFRKEARAEGAAKAAPITAADAVASEAPVGGPTTPPRRKRVNPKHRRQILILAGAGVLVLLLLGGVAVPALLWALSGSTAPPTVAASDSPEIEAGLPDDSEPDVDRDDEGSIAALPLPGAGPGENTLPGGPADVDVSPLVPPDTNPADPLNPTEGDEPGLPADEPPPGEGDPAELPADATDDPPAATDDPPPTAEPPAEEPPAEEPAPPAEEPPAPPADDNKKPDFKNLPRAIALPARSGETAEEMVVLGEVDARARAPWSLRLLGGELPGRGGGRLELTSPPSGDGPQRWIVQHVAERGDGGVVAQFVRENNALKFQWARTAPQAAADHLTATLVTVSVDGVEQALAFIVPREAAPLVIDPTKAVDRVPIELDFAPDRSMLHFQVTRVESPFKDVVIQPSEPVAAGRSAGVAFQFKDAHNNLSPGAVYELTVSTRRNTLTVQNNLRAPNPSVFAMARQRFSGMRAQAEEAKKKAEQQMRDARAAERAVLQKQIQEIDAGLWLGDFVEKTAGGAAKIHYRVFIIVEGQEIDLVRSEPPKD